MYRIFDCLNGKVYDKLVDILIKNSDSYIFHLPNMGKILINERNAKFMKEYPIGYTEEFDQDLHNAYIKRMEWYLDLIRDDIIEVKTDTGYLDQVSNIEILVYRVAISERTKDLFSQTDDFSKWLYPAMPQDPCFFYKEDCMFECIAHEGLYFVYTDNKEIKKLLKKNKIHFSKE